MRGFLRSTLISVVALTISWAAKAQTSNLQLVSINTPTASAACKLFGSADSINITVRNLGPNNISGFDAGFRVNNGTASTETVSRAITNGAAITFTLANKANMSGNAVQSLKVWVSYSAESNRVNDTLILTAVNNITNFPYYEDFEANNGGWVPSGTNSSWAWGTPAGKAVITAAGQGRKAWMNGGLGGYYNSGENNQVTSPCFDFTNLKYPQISFKFIVETEIGWEDVWMEASTNGGSSWSLVGSAGQTNTCNTTNWYNDGTTWSGSSTSACGSCSNCAPGCGGGAGFCGKWTEARQCLSNLAGQSNVRFRFRFTGGTACQKVGFAFDSIVIAESTGGASFVQKDTACLREILTFTGVSNCSKSYLWNFGDGSPTSTAPAPKYQYRKSGKFTITLVSYNYCNRPDTFRKDIYILPAEKAEITVPTVNNRRFCHKRPGIITPQSALPGGKFYLNGGEVSTIDVSTLDTGTHRLVYIAKTTKGCDAYDTVFIRVNPSPNVKITGLKNNYCELEPAFTPTATPSGGAFSLNGVPISMIDPGQLPILTTLYLRYTYIDTLACTGVDSVAFTITRKPLVSYGAIPQELCVTQPAFALQGTPTSGTFTVNGTPASTLDPAALGTGTHRVIFRYSNAQGCANSDSIDVDILAPPVVNITGLPSQVCKSAPKFTPTANPTGGKFTLDGNPVTEVDPSTLTPGIHNLSYEFTAASGCKSTASRAFSVTTVPALSLATKPLYCTNEGYIPLVGNFTNGTVRYMGQPVTGFDPKVWGKGLYSVVYSYTDPITSCSDSIVRTFEIADTLMVSMILEKKEFCKFAPNYTPILTPAGGVLRVDGQVLNAIEVKSLSFGFHDISYTVIDPTTGCTSTVVDRFEIQDVPSGRINPSSNVILCEGESTTLTYDGGGSEPVLWSTGSTDRNITVSPTTDTWYYLTIPGCELFRDSVLVQVVPKPVADMTVTPLEGYVPLQVNGINNVPVQPSETWWMIGADSIAGNSFNKTFDKEGIYEVILHVRLPNGCIDTARVLVTVLKSPDYSIPNVFTPNKDNVNDLFGIIRDAGAGFLSFKMTILNRWGQIVYSTDSAEKPWNGTLEGGADAPVGTYYYEIISTALGGEERVNTGSVNLVR